MPYLRKLSVIYDAENKGLTHFSSDENKGLQSIAEIRCSVIKPLITDNLASIRPATNVEVVPAHAPQAFVWLFKHMHHGHFIWLLNLIEGV